MNKPIKYFEKPGPRNTEQIIIAVKKRIEEMDIKHIVVATRVGETALKLSKSLKNSGLNIVAIAHQYGYSKPGEWLISEEIRAELLQLGVKVLTATMPLSMPGKLFRANWKTRGPIPVYNTLFPFDIIADTLRMFGQGMKVCVEIVVMAADMGLIPIDEEVISIGGTQRGADTAVVIKPAHIHEIYTLRVREIIAKPR